jgi:dephospho-CoA kinase
MLRVGLTGGIASGKTVVSDRLRQLGAVVIDADQLAREVVQPGTPALSAIVGRFGPAVVSGGALDRPTLARIVFADPGARSDLERIVHPAVRARAAELESEAPGDAVVVHVIPLLVETGQHDDFDAVVVVDVEPETQLDRLQARSSLTADEAGARLAAQATREQRLAVADHVLDNSHSLGDLESQVDGLWSSLTARQAAGETLDTAPDQPGCAPDQASRAPWE